MPRSGLLLVNLGTPRSPGVSDVRRYLREFLSDPRVIDIPALPRWLLLNAVILPFRPRRSAAAYAKVWTAQGSPLLVHSLALKEAVARELGDAWQVELAMRYGEPSLAAAIDRLLALDLGRLVVLPLFPQYSDAATGSAVARVRELLDRRAGSPPIEIRGAFYADRGFIASFAEVAGRNLEGFAPDFVLFSYHGLPERQIRRGDPSGGHCLERGNCCERVGAANRDCYRAHCYATTRALAGELGLAPESHSTSFQSRLGRTPWIRPYTDEVLVELADRGVKRLAVLCPAFVADCLETVEEIGIRGAEQWRSLGGEELRLVPSLNAEPRWVRAVAAMAAGDS